MILLWLLYKKKFKIKQRQRWTLPGFWLFHIHLIFLTAPSLPPWESTLLLSLFIRTNLGVPFHSHSTGRWNWLPLEDLNQDSRNKEPKVVGDPFLLRDLTYCSYRRSSFFLVPKISWFWLFLHLYSSDSHRLSEKSINNQ